LDDANAGAATETKPEAPATAAKEEEAQATAAAAVEATQLEEQPPADDQAVAEKEAEEPAPNV
jgi:hypothetical protein